MPRHNVFFDAWPGGRRAGHWVLALAAIVLATGCAEMPRELPWLGQSLQAAKNKQRVEPGRRTQVLVDGRESQSAIQKVIGGSVAGSDRALQPPSSN